MSERSSFIKHPANGNDKQGSQLRFKTTKEETMKLTSQNMEKQKSAFTVIGKDK